MTAAETVVLDVLTADTGWMSATIVAAAVAHTPTHRTPMSVTCALDTLKSLSDKGAAVHRTVGTRLEFAATEQANK